MKEEIAVAIMMGNLKGSKSKPSNLLEFAKACRELKKLWGFAEMSKYFRISQYMLRQIDKINELKDPTLQKLIGDGKLGIEASYQLWRINEEKRKDVAEIIQNMTTEQIRTFVYMLQKNSNISVKECKKLFEKQEGVLNMLVLPLDTTIYNRLQKKAKKSKLSIHNYALKILEDGIDG